MIITYYGKQFFKIQQGDLTIAFNPISKNSKNTQTTNFGSDVALITTNYVDYNGKEQLSRGDREPFIINGPGDYEIKEIFIKGVLSYFIKDNTKYINTIYSLEIDGIKISFLGALSEEILSKEALELINESDILFIPIGDKYLIDYKKASKICSQIEPKIIIPMDYDSNSLKLFLKEMDEDKKEELDKLTLKKKDLENKENEIIILKNNL